jgi:hypothetical protein
MKLRLHGTHADCSTAAGLLRRTDGLHVQDQSRPYPDRTGELVRVYLTITLDLATSDHPAGDGAPGGERR